MNLIYVKGTRYTISIYDDSWGKAKAFEGFSSSGTDNHQMRQFHHEIGISHRPSSGKRVDRKKGATPD